MTKTLKKLTLPALFAAAVLAVAGAYVLDAETSAYAEAPPAWQSAEPQVLPIAIYNEDGVSAEVDTVRLYVQQPERANWLYVRAHQPYYHRGGWLETNGTYDTESAAAIRINDGMWRDVRDENVICAIKSKENECIAGGTFVTRFVIPVDSALQGENHIQFRYNEAKSFRSGYRVLEVGFLADTTGMYHFDPFVEGVHDPAMLTWHHDPQQLPDATQAMIDLGDDLWHNADLVQTTVTGIPIDATCSMCHAISGYDLQYFQYENEVIYARSRLHGLSPDSAKAITAYIRSLEIYTGPDSLTTVHPPGYPWAPPYQPGPTALASREHGDPRTAGQAFAEIGAWSWAAGAGLDWVMQDDINIFPFIFAERRLTEDPTPTVDRLSDGALNWHQISMDSTLNTRLIPHPYQFPDWNNWLPDIHPVDWYPSGFNNVLDELAALQAKADDAAGGTLSNLDVEIKQFYEVRDNMPATYIDSTRYNVLGKLSRQQWFMVRIWDILVSHYLQDVADEMYCGHVLDPFCEPLSWPGRQRIFFNVGPHIAEYPNALGQFPHMYGEGWDGYMTNLWYQLQMIINPGSEPESSGQTPIDWNYQINFTQSTKGEPHGMATTLNFLKRRQMFSNGYGVDGSGGNGYAVNNFGHGWTPAQVRFHNFENGMANSDEFPPYRNLSDSVEAQIMNASLRAWLDFNLRFPISEFPREGGVDDDNLYKPATYEPVLAFEAGKRRLTDGFYTHLHRFEYSGVEPTVLDSLADWGEAMWPLGDFEQYMIDGGN